MATEAPLPLQDKISYAATEKNVILKKLAETDYAAEALEQHNAYIAILT